MAEQFKVAFIGLGVMGFPMAGHLAKKGGHNVTVYNRSTDKAAQWVQTYGGQSAPTPAKAAAGCDFVFSCVGNDDDLRSIYQGGDGILAGAKRGAILIDNTTASASVARELYGAAGQRGVQFLDAPVSGGQAGAVNGALTVMVGGDEAAFNIAKPVIDSYARAVTLMGAAGAGQLTKMVNQIAIAGLLQGLSEALAFSEKAGLDTSRVLDVISKGAAQSWQMENRGRTMIKNEFNFGFAVQWMRKDLRICLEQARATGARLPATALIDQFYAQVEARGGKRWDTSSLIHLLLND
ncbi:MAG: NAD(P)-dependent oxidoreductase [Gammaproteobacteria bacterium]